MANDMVNTFRWRIWLDDFPFSGLKDNRHVNDSLTFPCFTEPTNGNGDFVLSGLSTLSRPLSFFIFLSTELLRGGGEESPFAKRFRTALAPGDDLPYNERNGMNRKNIKL